MSFFGCLRKRKTLIVGHNGVYSAPNSMGTLPQSGLMNIRTSAIGIGNLYGRFGNLRSEFNYEDLIKATNGFSPHNIIGSGGFGCVYKGVLADGTEVAVKELRVGGGQGECEFNAEVKIMSEIRHHNLVSLVGYSISRNKRLLIYEYLPNNTLHFHLHVSERVLDWPTRVKIAYGIACGIAYLHEGCRPHIIHHDIKSPNILLDENFEARVSDFGFAKLATDLYSPITTRAMGTFGYMAPECTSSGTCTEKSDVYSFGVVLLELITGRNPVDVQPLWNEGLVEWARPLLSHALETEEFTQLIDPRLGMNFVPTEMLRMIIAADACVQHSATTRPRMGHIVRALDSLDNEALSNRIRQFWRMTFGCQNCNTHFVSEGSSAPNSK